MNIRQAISHVSNILSNYSLPVVSVSGGADSDLLVDLICKTLHKDRCYFVHFDNGFDFSFMPRHILELQNRYGITIHYIKSDITAFEALTKYGVPVVNKLTSANISRCQKLKFDWQHSSMLPEYLKRWWNSTYQKKVFNIRTVRSLREYIQSNPPAFAVSDKCCHICKVKIANEFIRNLGGDLSIVGLRRSEGDRRSSIHDEVCVRDKKAGIMSYFPLLHWSADDCEIYRTLCNIPLPVSVRELGISTSSCLGCPLAGGWSDMWRIKEREPKIYKLSRSIFSQSQEWMRNFAVFKRRLSQ